MKKFFTVLASTAMLVGLVSSANAAAPAGPAAKKAPTAANVAKRIQSGKLKVVTAKQAPGLKALLAKSRNGRVSTVGTNYIGSYQEQGRLWYDYRWSSFTSSSSYYGYYYYKNWKVCNTSYSGCLAAGSYDYYYYIYYYGTWYYGGWYGPYSG